MKRIAGALAIGLAATWVYLPCLNGTWLWDDGLEITQNMALRDPGGWWRPWIHPEGMDYFPLKSSLQWVEWHLWGAHPLGYHLVSLGLHIASALLIWRLLHLLGLRLAFVGAILFAVHPLAVESVAWISEFKNTLSLPPLLLAATAYLEHDRDGRRGAWVRSLAWFFVALACKTSVVMFPIVLLLYSWWKRGRLVRRDVLAALPFFAVAAALGAATVWFQSTRSIGMAGIPETFASRMAQAGWSIIAYAGMCLWPAGVAPIYPAAPSYIPPFLPWVAIGVVLGAFWLKRAGWGCHALLGGGWFLLNLVPVLGIIPMAYYRVSPRADHFVYLPLVGIIGLAAAGLSAGLGALERRAARRLPFRFMAAACASAAAAALAVEAHAYSSAFRDEKALWTSAVERNPTSWLARNNLGKALYQEGRASEASEQFRRAIALKPDSPEAHANLGNCLQAEGMGDDARAQYAAALGINPKFAGARYDLGLSYLRAGRLKEAEAQFRATLELDPGHANARNNLGLVLAGMGRLPEAMDQYRLALGLNPEMPEAHLNLGNAFYRQGRFDEAAGEYRSALRLQPEYSAAHNNLGHALAAQGRKAEAELEFAEAKRAANH